MRFGHWSSYPIQSSYSAYFGVALEMPGVWNALWQKDPFILLGQMHIIIFSTSWDFKMELSFSSKESATGLSSHYKKKVKTLGNSVRDRRVYPLHVTHLQTLQQIGHRTLWHTRRQRWFLNVCKSVGLPTYIPGYKSSV